MKTIEHLSYERLQVLENIARAASEGNYWKKVEISDHHVTREERERLAARFDNDRRSPLARMRASAASRLADGLLLPEACLLACLLLITTFQVLSPK